MNVKHWWSDAADNDALVLGENRVLSATFSITNSARASLDWNSSLRGERPAVDRLSHGTATNCHPVDIMYCVKQRHSLFYILDILWDRVIK
jgi:hypothetical protein